jgi:putative membrane protein
VLVALGASAIAPHDVPTWLLEALPVLVALPLLVLTWRRFPLTPLLYRLIFLHALVLLVGAHYTYAQVPAGFWVQDWLGLSRNHYDRLGHVMQGVVPAILAREILLRRGVLREGGWLFLLVSCVCLAFSALYEMIEWWVAVAFGSEAEAFLATQGDVWDTQWDMFLALCGALLAQLALRRMHRRQIENLTATNRREPA